MIDGLIFYLYLLPQCFEQSSY